MSKPAKIRKLKPTDPVSLILPLIFILLSAMTRIWWLMIAEGAALLLYYVFRYFNRKRYNAQLYSYLHSMTEYLDEASRENLTTFPMPITLLDGKGNILWYNDLFH